jgi:hypothetical protein
MILRHASGLSAFSREKKADFIAACAARWVV